ncbi:MAG: hypothetical protein ACTS6J_04635 [Burkholderiales bacterium]
MRWIIAMAAHARKQQSKVRGRCILKLPRGYMDNWIDLFSWIFLVTNLGRIFAYLPQIRAALHCRNGAKSISRLTWGYFAISHATVSIYGFLVLHDASMGVIFLGNCIACCALVAIVTWKQSGRLSLRNSRSSTSMRRSSNLPGGVFSRKLMPTGDNTIRPLPSQVRAIE